MPRQTQGIIVPQDEGTGLQNPDDADFTSAGHIGGMHSHDNATDYVQSGLEPDFSEVITNGEIDITAGIAHMHYPDAITVQDTGGVYNEDWNGGMNFTVSVPETMIDMVVGEVNHIYLSIGLQQNNDVKYHILTTDTTQTLRTNYGGQVSSDPREDLESFFEEAEDAGIIDDVLNDSSDPLPSEPRMLVWKEIDLT